MNATVSQKWNGAERDFVICSSDHECDASAIAFAMSKQYSSLVYTVRKDGVVQYQFQNGRTI